MMILKELIRFSTQHRTLYCYMILSIWIFLLIAGMYKYVGHNASGINALSFFSEKAHGSSMDNDLETEEALKLKKFKERCTPMGNLGRREDGGILEGWKLQGVLLIIRHGDRGPMSHVRSTESIDCGVHDDNLVNKYRSFLFNTSTSSSTNHMYWNKVGPFHGFTLLPALDSLCLLGQLSYKGIAQLLHLGEMLHQIYAHPLGLLYKQIPNRSTYDPTPHSLLNSDEVVLFTTRYRRTFQSAMAFLYSFLPPDKWLSMNVRESHSMSFCFTDCACPHADELRKRLNVINAQHLAKHPTVSGVMQWIGSTLLQYSTNVINDPKEIVDAILTVLCHDAPLPCRHVVSNSSNTSPVTTPVSNMESNDVINIDQDENSLGSAANGNSMVPAESNSVDNTLGFGSDLVLNEGCIEQSHVSTLLSYVDWQSKREAQHSYYRRMGLMRAYGMVRHIVSFMLKMISGDRTKFVLYSGHDWTLQYLTAALGIKTDSTHIPYAARLAIEVYKSEAHTEYYFRLVYNGRDVTKQIEFCEGGRSLRVTRDSRGNKADLCPYENIIRFLHEDYFAPLNATNFKDACYALPKENGF